MKIEINIPDRIMEEHTETDIKMYIAVSLYEKEIEKNMENAGKYLQ